MLLHTSEAARSGPVDSVDKKLQVKSLEHAAALRWQPHSSTQEVPGEIAGQSGFQDFMISGQRRSRMCIVRTQLIQFLEPRRQCTLSLQRCSPESWHIDEHVENCAYFLDATKLRTSQIPDISYLQQPGAGRNLHHASADGVGATAGRIDWFLLCCICDYAALWPLPGIYDFLLHASWRSACGGAGPQSCARRQETGCQ